MRTHWQCASPGSVAKQHLADRYQRESRSDARCSPSPLSRQLRARVLAALAASGPAMESVDALRLASPSTHEQLLRSGSTWVTTLPLPTRSSRVGSMTMPPAWPLPDNSSHAHGFAACPFVGRQRRIPRKAASCQTGSPFACCPPSGCASSRWYGDRVLGVPRRTKLESPGWNAKSVMSRCTTSRR